MVASPGRPRCVAFSFSMTNVCKQLPMFVLEKKNTATHRGRPSEAKRTHPLGVRGYAAARPAQLRKLSFKDRAGICIIRSTPNIGQPNRATKPQSVQ